MHFRTLRATLVTIGENGVVGKHYILFYQQGRHEKVTVITALDDAAATESATRYIEGYNRQAQREDLAVRYSLIGLYRINLKKVHGEGAATRSLDSLNVHVF